MTAVPQLEAVITDLVMTKAPRFRTVPQPRGRLALLRAWQPTVSFYRYLYNVVGERWFWWERRAMDDTALATLIGDEKTEIYIIYVDGVPAGFAELDNRQFDDDGTTDIALLGIVPEFLGHGYGWYLANWIVDAAWQREPKRMTTQISSFDHPRAAGMLQRIGFHPVGQRVVQMEDPRRRGLISVDTPLPTEHEDKQPPAGPNAVIMPLPRRRE